MHARNTANKIIIQTARQNIWNRQKQSIIVSLINSLRYQEKAPSEENRQSTDLRGSSEKKYRMTMQSGKFQPSLVTQKSKSNKEVSFSYHRKMQKKRVHCAWWFLALIFRARFARWSRAIYGHLCGRTSLLRTQAAPTGNAGRRQMKRRLDQGSGGGNLTCVLCGFTSIIFLIKPC